MNILNRNIPTPSMGQAQLPPDLMQGIQQVKQMQSMFGGNMNAMFQQMAQSNPQFSQAMQMARSGNPEQIVRQMCQQRGIDFNAFISALR
nr:MAG TPA: hypothetical protein [Caudoviricetes sp.]